MNKALILGNLGANPEMRSTAGGQSVATLNVATNEVWFDKQGQKQERTEWHKIVVWGKQADFCGQYLTKGSTVFVEGRIQTRSWEDQTGAKRYTTEIVATSVQAVGGRGGSDQSSHGGADQGGGYHDGPIAEPIGMPSTTPNAIPDDDVPF
jgi:single-strand DNA-binding protein